MIHMSDCTILRITKSAILVEYLEEEIWLPLSVIKLPAAAPVVGEGGYTISIPEWLAKEKGIDKED